MISPTETRNYTFKGFADDVPICFTTPGSTTTPPVGYLPLNDRLFVTDSPYPGADYRRSLWALNLIPLSHYSDNITYQNNT
jgi:hypothetical protein